MANQKLQYIIELVKQGDLQGAVRELQAVDAQAARTGNTVEASGQKMVEAFKAVAGAVVIREMVRFGTEAIREFEQAEQAAAKLDGTLRASGQYSARYSADLQQLAASLQKVTGVGDETILNVESQLVAFGAARADIPRLTETVLDLAEGMGMDLNAAALLVGKTLQGEFSTLSRFGIVVNENASQSEKLAEALHQIDTRFGGLARAAGETATAGLVKLKNEIGDLKEIIGEFVVTGLQPMVNLLHQVVAPSNLGGWQKAVGGTADVDAQNRKLRAQLEDEAFQAASAGRIKWQEAQKLIAGMDRAFVSSGGLVDVDQQRTSLNAAMAKLHPDIARSEAADPERVKAVTEEEKTARKELLKLHQELTLATLTGIDHERLAAAQAAEERQQQIKRLVQMSGMPAEEQARAQADLNSILDESLDTQIKQIELKELEGQLAEAEKADAAERAQQAKLQQVIEQGLLELEREQAREIAEQAREQEQLTKLNDQRYAIIRENEFQLAELHGDLTVRLNAEFQARRQAINDYYDLEIERASENADLMAELEAERTAALQVNAELQKEATDDFKLAVKDMGQAVTRNFAAGVSGAFVQMIQGTKSAGAAFREFAADFMAQTAQMIMQIIILATIKRMLAGTSFGIALGFSEGGFAPRLAANGLLGVQEVNSPTYLRNYNVVAGEAGPEVLTVLSRPRTMNFGSIPAIVGNVAGRSLAITEAANLASVRRAADGIMTGAPASGPASGGVSGRAQILVRMEPGLRGQIVDDAIEGATVRLQNDLSQHSPTSEAVKNLTS